MKKSKKGRRIDSDELDRTFYQKRGRRPKIRALTEAQGHYIISVQENDVTFGIGPAGTGKTYVSTCLAAESLSKGDVEKIIFCRPMVGCDEDMGALPGDIHQKYDPWVEPVVEVLEERLGRSQVQMFLKNGKIQAKPMMYMRGKTFDNSFVILDEAQNTTPQQMKMFLTRIGNESIVVVDGDLDQSDLKDKRGNSRPNGLEEAVYNLKDITGIGIVRFDIHDIVRSGLVKRILEAYA